VEELNVYHKHVLNWPFLLPSGYLEHPGPRPNMQLRPPGQKNRFRNDFKIRGKRTDSKMKPQNEKMKIK
jgi:hypothetical protein